MMEACSVLPTSSEISSYLIAYKIILN